MAETWASNPILIGISLLATIITIIVFVTGRSSLVHFLPSSSSRAASKPSPKRSFSSISNPYTEEPFEGADFFNLYLHTEWDDLLIFENCYSPNISWSPDNKKLLVWGHAPASCTSYILLVDSDGRNKRIYCLSERYDNSVIAIENISWQGNDRLLLQNRSSIMIPPVEWLISQEAISDNPEQIQKFGYGAHNVRLHPGAYWLKAHKDNQIEVISVH